MAEYIERQKAIDLFSPVDPENDGSDGTTLVCQSLNYSSAEIESMLSDMPTEDVAQVRHGRWDSSGKYRFQKDNSVAVRCTECGCSLTEPEYRCNVWNYCPVCGAKMDLEVPEK